MLWGQEALRGAGAPDRRWLWHGYLLPGAVTLLTSQWKSGKTTLASILLSRLKGGGQLAGLPLAAGRAVVVSEEPCEKWQERSRELDFGDHVGWCCRPFAGKPRPAEWQALIGQILEVHASRNLSLVLIDPLSLFLPARSENDATCVQEAVMPLQRLASAGLSVWANHHPRKGRSAAGQAARGSGALAGFADILVEMRWYRRATDDDRRRKLVGFSRYKETPRQLVIELNAEGTDYVAHGSFEDEEFRNSWEALRLVLAAAPHKLTRREVLARWQHERTPDGSTLYRWLEHGVALGLVRRDGEGVRTKPFRYWLPECEERWRDDPLAMLLMPELFGGKRLEGQG
jgi:hypothetical protein